ncbi:hypothetical protein PN462_20430 [Spirulina sp. CS-785/01]|uniref:hypothetical protein n=1 Tax=Spirulina sp. CS-785/01 TaxID=3021716 RepID=UPI0023301DA9|nr:hypothetical protein [Spirulina sp. CS-785/01]MDB9315492.1 hypothetical protein [Spirulina sp. CS-785/01]
MQITFDLPDEVVAQLHPIEDKLPQVLELGLRDLEYIVRIAKTRALVKLKETRN